MPRRQARSNLRSCRPHRNGTLSPKSATATKSPSTELLVQDDEFVTPDEEAVATYLTESGFKWRGERENEELPTGLTGKGKRFFRADFYIEEYRLYIEVSRRRFSRVKRSKARNAEEYSQFGSPFKVLYLGIEDLDRLANGEVLIRELIAKKMANYGVFVPLEPPRERQVHESSADGTNGI